MGVLIGVGSGCPADGLGGSGSVYFGDPQPVNSVPPFDWVVDCGEGVCDDVAPDPQAASSITSNAGNTDHLLLKTSPP